MDTVPVPVEPVCPAPRVYPYPCYTLTEDQPELDHSEPNEDYTLAAIMPDPTLSETKHGPDDEEITRHTGLVANGQRRREAAEHDREVSQVDAKCGHPGATLTDDTLAAQGTRDNDTHDVPYQHVTPIAD